MLLQGLVICLAFVVSRVDSHQMACFCSKAEYCQPLKKVINTEPEIYVFSRETTNVNFWLWKTIDTVVIPSFFEKDNLLEGETMCITHAQGKKFGITVDFNITQDDAGRLDKSQAALQSWQADTYLKQLAWHADVVTIDLIPYFMSDTSSHMGDHLVLAKTLFDLRNILNNTEVICIVPWKPPCTKKLETCHFASLVRDACDYFVLSPDSFLYADGSRCVARANIPFSKLLYGISEYTSHHIPSNRLILGVSWHGYDYTCTSLVTDKCSFSQDINDTSSETCNFDSRKRVSNGDIVTYHGKEYTDHKQNELYYAPFFNYKVGSVNHQVWFEDHRSLQYKYRLLHELKLRGLAILYGDDLSPQNNPYLLSNEKQMWTWLMHDALLKSSKPAEHHDLHWADTVAGVAVGCFLLGALVGVIFTCISMQKRIRKPRRPFHGDTDPLSDEYLDNRDL